MSGEGRVSSEVDVAGEDSQCTVRVTLAVRGRGRSSLDTRHSYTASSSSLAAVTSCSTLTVLSRAVVLVVLRTVVGEPMCSGSLVG